MSSRHHDLFVLTHGMIYDYIKNKFLLDAILQQFIALYSYVNRYYLIVCVDKKPLSGRTYTS